MPGFHRLTREERGQVLAEWLQADAADVFGPLQQGGLSLDTAERLAENVVGIHALPFAVAPNFIIDGRETLVPMVIEEPSVVAAAANGARIARAGGGFSVRVDDPVMICQIQLFADDVEEARGRILRSEEELLSSAASADPILADLGGGPVDLEVRIVPPDGDDPAFVVVHLHVNVLDAMGANAVNTMGEFLAPRLEELTGGRAGLRILSNLADRRLVDATTGIPLEALAMEDYEARRVRDGIVAASRFAERDPYRAATHNKGIMNGVDAVVLATGNDWRAVEAGAHAWAARNGVYRPLCTWQKGDDGRLIGRLQMPMAVGVVGGTTQIHPNARLALRIMGATSARDLARVAAAAGMANNLAALRALATEGIQRGHMRLHGRSRELG